MATRSAVRVESVSAGLHGYFKIGEWSPLHWHVSCDAATKVRVVVECNDPDDNIAVSESTRPLPVGESRWESHFRSARGREDITVRLLSEDGRTEYFHKILRPGSGGLHPGLKANQSLRLTLGYPAAALGGDDANRGRLWIHLSSPADFPTLSRSLAGVECVVLCLGSAQAPPSHSAWNFTPAQSAALRDWVRTGGHLVISMGDGTLLKKSPLHAWIPVTLAENEDLRRLPVLEGFLANGTSLSVNGKITAARFSDHQGPEVLVRELESPLLVRVPVGFGRVTVFGLDLNDPVFTANSVLGDLTAKLVGPNRGPLVNSHVVTAGQLSTLGVSDLASQLHGALEEFPGVSRIPYWTMMGLLLAYIAILGPLDYLIVHRWWRRPHLTWITFPLIVALAAAGSIHLAQSRNGNSVELNQLTLLDYDAQSGLTRGRSWCTLLSPRTQRYSVELETPGAIEQHSTVANPPAPGTGDKTAGEQPASRLSWFGVPENAVGGLYRSAGINATGRIYHLTDQLQTPDIPVQHWSTKSLWGAWEQTGPPAAVSHLESSGTGRLRGSIAHYLPATLEDAILVFGGRIYFSERNRRRLSPAEEWEPAGFQSQQRDLRAYLTGTEASRGFGKHGAEIVVHTTPYDVRGTDLLEIVRMVSFHQASGGKHYTGLENSLLSSLELTDLTESGRAVLFGRFSSERTPPAATVRVKVEGQPAPRGPHATLVRIVLPVKHTAAEIPVHLQRAGALSSSP